MAAEPRRRRRQDDDDEGDAELSVVPPRYDDGDEGDGPEYSVEEGERHARSYRGRRPADDVDERDEEDDDQIIPDRVVRLPLPKPWNKLRIYAWLDYPEETAVLFGPKRDDETADDAGERIIEGLRQVITRHDGWRDRDGKMPQPSTRAFWRRISTPLSRAIMEAFFAAIRRNPTPAASPKKSRRR